MSLQDWAQEQRRVALKQMKRGQPLVHADYGPCRFVRTTRCGTAVVVQLPDGIEGTCLPQLLRRAP